MDKTLKQLFITVLLLCGSVWGTACPGSYTNWYAINIRPQFTLSSDQSNFPMLFIGSTQLATVANGGHAALTTGVDIIFCDGNNTGNLLAYELVGSTYSQTTGAGEWWIKVPTVSHTITSTIYVGVGNAGASDLSAAATVWSAYLGVWHYGTSGALSVTDSTGINTSVNHSVTAATGQIQGGGSFVSASTQYIDTGGKLQPTSSQISILGWLKPTTCPSNARIIGNMDASFVNGWETFLTTSCTIELQGATGSTLTHTTMTSRLVTGVFSHFAAIQNGTGSTSQSLYLNGISVGGSQTGTTGIGTATVNANLGRWTGGAANYYNGVEDEIEVYNGVVSADWVNAAYLNQGNPTGFYSVSGSPNTILSSVVDQMPGPLQSMEANGQACVYGKNVVSGNTLFVGASSNLAVTGISDTLGSSWTLVDSNTSVSQFAYGYIAAANGSGADTVTITGTLGFTAMTCSEFPAAVGTTVDVHTNGSWANSAASIATTPITTTTDGDLFLTVISGSSSGSTFQTALPLQFLQLTNGSGGSATGFGFTQTNGNYSATWKNVAAGSTGGYVAFALKPAAIIIDTASLPSASLTNSYNYCLQARGGAGLYTWSISSGALPTGLSIASDTGCITGTPISTTTTPTFQVTDGTHTTTKVLTLTVNSSVGTIALTSSCSAHATSCAISAVTGQVIVFYEWNDVAITPPSDTCSTTYKFAGVYSAATTEITLSIFAGIAGGTGSCTITAATASGPANVAALQYSNAQLFYDSLGWTGGLGTAAATIIAPNIPTFVPNSIAFASAAPFTAAATATIQSPFTSRISANNFGIGDNTEVSPGVYIPTFVESGNTNGNWVIGGLSLRPTTSGVVNSNHYFPQMR